MELDKVQVEKENEYGEKDRCSAVHLTAQEYPMMAQRGNEPLRINEIKDKSVLADSSINSNLRYERIAERLSLFRDNYEQFIQSLGRLVNFFNEIPAEPPTTPDGALMPHWSNNYLSPGDAMALCGFLFKYNPVVYMEIGSGNSTKFAKRVISHFNLRTKIISIDPSPRAEIDSICDESVRAPMQMVPKGVFQALRKDNILFIDGSHRCLQNSDVTYMFLDVLPDLSPGVLIHFHDIFFPEDYPSEWAERFYSEQYLLGVLLLFGSGYEILYSSRYVRLDRELSGQFVTLLNKSPSGGSLWMRLNQ
jgi:hypothetical protein